MLATFTHEARGDATVLSICGEIDLSNVSDLGNAIHAAVEQHSVNLVVDLTSVTYLDSTCLRELIRARHLPESGGPRLLIVAPAASIARKILEHSGLIEALATMGSVDEALGTTPQTHA